MQGGQFRPELARAFLNYFGEKGAATPGLAREILPVVLLDDASGGPYAPSVRWHASAEIIPSAGNLGYVGIINDDPIQQAQSVVVVDRIFFQNMTAAAHAVVGIAPRVGVVSMAAGPVRDTDSGKDPTSQIDPILSNIKIGTGQSSTLGIIATQFPLSAINEIVEIPGTFILRPQGALLLTNDAVASQIRVYFRGRYYPAP